MYREWRSVRAVLDAKGKASHFVIVFYEIAAPRNGMQGSLPEQQA